MASGVQAALQYRLAPPSLRVRGPSGVQVGAGSGTSIDFHDFREYLPGDDLRRVDWGAYARTDHLVLRLYRSEIAPVLEIVLDPSGSMRLVEGKAAAAVFAAAFFAGLARQGEGRPVLVWGRERHTGAAVEAELARRRFGGPGAVERWGETAGATPRALRVVISDFLFQTDFAVRMRAWARGAAALVCVQVLAAEEVEPTVRGAVRFFDIEARQRLLEVRVDEEAVSAYRERLKRHCEAVRESALGVRAGWIPLVVPDDWVGGAGVEAQLAPALLDLHVVERPA